MASVVFTRGDHDESAHALAWCATGPDGEPAAASDADAGGFPVFPRSAAKPLQALPAVRAGVLERFGLGERHLALACASHGGTDGHVAVVAETLAAVGMDEDDLGCGPLEPLFAPAAAALRAWGREPTRIVHNCSGKHALGLALCVHEGWDPRGYLEADHPLQQAMHAALADAAVCRIEEVSHGTDGCGMLAFRMPLRALARAFGRLASGALGPAGETVARAMHAHPGLVAFPGGIDTELMVAEPGLVAKVGAEGVLALGLPDGRGAALKVLDGARRALDPAGVALAREVLGLAAAGAPLEALARPVVANSRGDEVGAGEARL